MIFYMKTSIKKREKDKVRENGITLRYMMPVHDASLLNAQQSKNKIKDKWRNPGKGVVPSPTLG